jgi:hypothetical protein
MFPGIYFFEDGARGVGESDFSAVFGRGGKSFEVMFFDDGNGDSEVVEGAGGGESGDSSSDNDDVVRHELFLEVGGEVRNYKRDRRERSSFEG